MINDQYFSMPFQQKKETIQYNVTLPMTGTIRRSSRGKLYQHSNTFQKIQILNTSLKYFIQFFLHTISNKE